MSQEALPAAVLDLVARSLASMEQIETLLLLHRAEGAGRRLDDVARELQIAPAAAAASLAALETERLVERAPAAGDSSVAAPGSGAYRYAPATPALRTAVDLLAVAYNTRPVTLIKALYSRPPRAVTSFADAFRLRGPAEGR